MLSEGFPSTVQLILNTSASACCGWLPTAPLDSCSGVCVGHSYNLTGTRFLKTNSFHRKSKEGARECLLQKHVDVSSSHSSNVKL